MKIIGIMTGTSLDGIDAVKIEISDDFQTLKILQSTSQSFSPQLQQQLRNLAQGKATFSSKDIQNLNHVFSTECCKVVNCLIKKCVKMNSYIENGDTKTTSSFPKTNPILPPWKIPLVKRFDVDLIAAHGQTIYHCGKSTTWQMFLPSLLANSTGIPCVSNFRMNDILNGGDGAPLSPIGDYYLFKNIFSLKGDNLSLDVSKQTAIVLNLGGFCNYSFFSQSKILGGKDICPFNHILDSIARKRMNCEFDKDGMCALKGVPHIQFQNQLVSMLIKLCKNNHSLGSVKDMTLDWVDDLKDISPSDCAMTACVGLAKYIYSVISPLNPTYIILSGGGALNSCFVKQFKSISESSVVLSNSLGIDFFQREAAIMAILGFCSYKGIPITFPETTGVSKPCRGGEFSWPGL